MSASAITLFRNREVVTGRRRTGKLSVEDVISKRAPVAVHEVVWVMSNNVKILFRLERDASGYPPEEWESVWAHALGNDRYRIDNIPFFVRGVSLDDIVLGLIERGEVHFKKLLEQSENSTVRVVVYDNGLTEFVRRDLRVMGCSSEGTGIQGLISINIPRLSAEKALAYIRKGFDEGRWDYEEGALRA